MTNITATSEKQEAKTFAKRDPFLVNIMTRTPAEIETWVENNVNTAAEMKTLLKKVTMLLSVVAQEVYDGDN